MTMYEDPKPPSYSDISAKNKGVPLTTTNEFPGSEIIDFHGVVYGSFACKQTQGSQPNSVRGDIGEHYKYADQLKVACGEANKRLVAETLAAGGNAALGMRIEVTYPDQNRMQVICYATAVTIARKRAAKS